MKNETELIVIAIDLEIEKLKKEIKNFNEKFNRSIDKNDFDFSIGYLNGKIELIRELEKYLDLRRSKLSLVNLDSSYDVDTDNNFSKDDIPF